MQVCAKSAITMIEDKDGFRYPLLDESKCVECGLCKMTCPKNNMPLMFENDKYVFGGYHKDSETRFESTSGGAFSAIVDVFCDENYVIFGAEADGLNVSHKYIMDKAEIFRFRKSKYTQSNIGGAYTDAKDFLQQGKKVLFSGTPCQIAGLKSYLGSIEQGKLLTVEVVCEGVPSPLYIRKLEQSLYGKYGAKVKSLDYRYKGKSLFSNGKWDFQQTKIELENRKKEIKIDRWFNPFWSVWLQHLMSRPSCYECPFAKEGRVADITLGDLWGVHIYCPELYGKNGGSSLVVCNTEKGKKVGVKAQNLMVSRELRFEDAIKYQGPMRRHLTDNPKRDDFMKDLRSDMDYDAINRKWANKPSMRLLFQKYIWGNRQKVFMWNLFNNRK